MKGWTFRENFWGKPQPLKINRLWHNNFKWRMDSIKGFFEEIFHSQETCSF
jgi:hypothetical protein